MCRPKSRFGSIQPGGKFYRLVSTVRYQSPRMHEHFSLSLSLTLHVRFSKRKVCKRPCSSPPPAGFRAFRGRCGKSKKKKKRKENQIYARDKLFFSSTSREKEGNAQRVTHLSRLRIRNYRGTRDITRPTKRSPSIDTY